jgi:hypothetical protein
MAKRGRKSSADLSIVPVNVGRQRLPPPVELTPGQAQIWTAIVDSMPPGWFRPNDTLLTLFCRHVDMGNHLAKLINEHRVDLDNLKTLGRLLRMRAAETALMANLAVKMRLTQQARITPRSAGRQVESNGPAIWRRPWEDQ